MRIDKKERIKDPKGYFFIRRLATSPPIPNSVPITIMLGSGTAGGADEDRLATRKPSSMSPRLRMMLWRDDDNKTSELWLQ
jgi:hypothetical protein